jgi:hypothetical protein
MSREKIASLMHALNQSNVELSLCNLKTKAVQKVFLGYHGDDSA